MRVTDVRFNKNFKVSIINMFKELKKTMLKDAKESIMTVFHQIENINKEIEIIKKKKKKRKIELKSPIIKMKNSLKEFNSRFELAEERVNECEDRSIEII